MKNQAKIEVKIQQKTIKDQPQIIQKSTKILPKSVLELVLGHLGAILAPRGAQEPTKTAKRHSQTPLDPQVGIQDPPQIDPEAFQKR